MPNAELHKWQKGDPITHKRLNEMRDAIMSIFTVGKGLAIKAFGQKIVLENTQPHIIPSMPRASTTQQVFRLESGPDGDDLYTARKQIVADYDTFVADSDTDDYLIRFLGLSEAEADALPEAGHGERWHDKYCIAFSQGGTNAAPWSDATLYGIGDQVYYGGDIWSSAQGNNSNHTPAAGAWWTENVNAKRQVWLVSDYASGMLNLIADPT